MQSMEIVCCHILLAKNLGTKYFRPQKILYIKILGRMKFTMIFVPSQHQTYFDQNDLQNFLVNFSASKERIKG